MKQGEERRRGGGASAGPWQEAGPTRKEARPRAGAGRRKQEQGVRGQGPGARTNSRRSQVQWTL